jgi:hypothetical protein
LKQLLALLLAAAPLFAQNPVGPAATPSQPQPSASTADRTIHHSQLLSDAQVAAAIAKATGKHHGAVGLTLNDVQASMLSAMACNTCHVSGYTVTIYTPEQWIEQLAINAKSEMISFSVTDVTPEMREPLLHVVALPSKADYINGAGLSEASSVHRVVLTDRTKTTIIQPVSNENGTVESNSALRSISYGTATSTFQMLDVDKVRGDDNGEFYVVVVGDKENKYFKVKTRMFKQLFGSESTGM